jgi:hypothetical protein
MPKEAKEKMVRRDYWITVSQDKWLKAESKRISTKTTKITASELLRAAIDTFITTSR